MILIYVRIENVSFDIPLKVYIQVYPGPAYLSKNYNWYSKNIKLGKKICSVMEIGELSNP